MAHELCATQQHHTKSATNIGLNGHFSVYLCHAIHLAGLFALHTHTKFNIFLSNEPITSTYIQKMYLMAATSTFSLLDNFMSFAKIHRSNASAICKRNRPTGLGDGHYIGWTESIPYGILITEHRLNVDASSYKTAAISIKSNQFNNQTFNNAIELLIVYLSISWGIRKIHTNVCNRIESISCVHNFDSTDILRSV